MSTRWGITAIYHDGRPPWHSFNCSERNAREFFEAFPTYGKISLTLWRRHMGKRVTVDQKLGRLDRLRIAE